ncbi:MAG: GntR family transcriptional regulator [Deltaproteobacteria bacterium]|nr:GntR family transcriptional regulator [Deltaproteobacteria bacterium]
MKKNICNILRERIVGLQYMPGEPLNEVKLSQEFNVSRTPIREALIRLSYEGLVTIIPNTGSRVSDLNIRDFQKLIELRLILETGAARLAAQNAEEKDLEELIALDAEIGTVREDDVFGLIACDVRFHHVIEQATHNEYVIRDLSVIRNQFMRIQKMISHKPVQMKADLPKVIHALRHRDADEMERLARKHVENFIARVREYF